MSERTLVQKNSLFLLFWLFSAFLLLMNYLNKFVLSNSSHLSMFTMQFNGKFDWKSYIKDASYLYDKI